MPKIRSLKREVLRNEDLADAGLIAKLLFIGLVIAVADDDGRFKASPRYLKQEIFPYDAVTEEQVGEQLACLATERMVGLYESEGKKYAVLANWKTHQRVPESRYEASRCPAPSAQLLRSLEAGTAQARRIQASASEQAEASPRARADRNRNGNGNGNGIGGEGEVASPSGDALARLKKLRVLVCDLWQKQRGWVKWPAEHRHDAIEITGWLKAKPYPAEFWQWAIPQVPADTKAFVRLTTPAGEGKRVGWLEDKFIDWREAQDRVRRADENDVPSTGEWMRQNGVVA